ncbi:MAG: ATP-binding protein [Deltaproteobacteria bacterium]|nr:ATP-binding protein [Deltaproteobacteria bacterium]
MFRISSGFLDSWLSDPARKPLIVRGARQVGKSFLIKDWGIKHFTHVVEANLERDPVLSSCFTDNDPRLTLQRLEAILRRPIKTDGSTLLFLDEIQAAPSLLAKLRWFAEEIASLPIIAAGSLLDFTLADHQFSMPVGRVTYHHLEPMGFEEFCIALDEQQIVRWLRENVTKDTILSGSAMPIGLHAKALKLFREWLLVGGMPAAVETYRQERSIVHCESIHRDLLATIRDDFAKYANRVHHHRLTATLDSIPHQLGCKFTYRRVDPFERIEAIRKSVDLLCLARICHRVVASIAQGLPLSAGANMRAFKLIYLDVGLATTALGLTLIGIENISDLTLINAGAIAEQAAGQLLRLLFPSNQEPSLYFWQRQYRGSEAEVDYIISHNAAVMPIEIKAGSTGTLKSLHQFMSDHDLPMAIRLNSTPPSITHVNTSTPTGKHARYQLLSLPCYLTEQLNRILATF